MRNAKVTAPRAFRPSFEANRTDSFASVDRLLADAHSMKHPFAFPWRIE
jgi:hypothetical protein